MHARDHVRVAVIGTGFGGLGAAVRLRRMGVTDFTLLERAGSVGGTWRDNTYPGCACDVPSHLYSFSFAPNPRWPRNFSGQQHIRAYLEWVTDTYRLRPHIRFDSEVTAARWDADALHWVVDTTSGGLTADVLVSAGGPLSDPKLPEIPGLDTFPGTVFHTARWDHDRPLRGQRVAVVGTGASAIQVVPAIQREVRRLTVFQRTPPWVLPRADREISRAEQWLHEKVPLTRAARRRMLWAIRELQVGAFAKHPDSLRAVERMALLHLRRGVRHPELRRRLVPEYRIGCKRILLSNSWYPTLDRPHVDVVSSGLAEVRGNTLIASDGTEAEADAIILGTGFQVTELPIAERITGAEGGTLADHWKDGMAALRGATADGFPNLFFVIGPNTGLGNSSMILMIEAQLNYLMDYLGTLTSLGPGTALAPRPEAVRRYNDDIQRRMARTVWNSGGCTSWYLDANGRNTTVWPGSTGEFARITRAVDLREYDVLRAGRPAAATQGAI